MADSAQKIQLILSPKQLTIASREIGRMKVILSEPLPMTISVFFNKTANFQVLPSTIILPANKSSSISAEILALSPISETVIAPKSCKILDHFQPCSLVHNNTFLRLRVVHSFFLDDITIFVGWIYFLAWSVSFYPQIWLNFSRKSVIGLNFDFLMLNITGFFCYLVFNVVMFWSSKVQTMYQSVHPHSANPVLLNDVFFSVHAFCACAFTIFQCFIYERNSQRVSNACRTILGLFVILFHVSLLLTFMGTISYLVFIVMLSYVKIAITLIKYMPQAFFNYRRKSTIGWSIGNILLDLTGGLMDLLQMIIQSFNTGNNDWSVFSGDVAKVGLGSISIVFDIFFIIQHYILYRNSSYEGPALLIDNNDDSLAHQSYGSIE